MEYTAVLSREGRNTLIAFPDAPGCQTFAEPGEDAEAVARDALEGWLEAHFETGEVPARPSPGITPRKGERTLAVRIAPRLAVALQIRWARSERGLSQGALAQQLGVTRQQISLVESPDANLRFSTLEKVAEALGVELEVSLQPRAKRAS